MREATEVIQKLYTKYGMFSVEKLETGISAKELKTGTEFLIPDSKFPENEKELKHTQNTIEAVFLLYSIN